MLHLETATRRRVLSAGAGLMGMNLGQSMELAAAPRPDSKADAVIFVFLFGGPSQFETFDMKPEAPEKIRGPFKTTACRTPGLRICEHLPRLASLSDQYCVLRTLGHSYNDHSGGAHYIQTGKRWHVPIGGGFNPTPRDWPSVGSGSSFIDIRNSGASASESRYFVVPNSLGRLQEAGQYRRPGEHAGWLGRAYGPVTTAVDKKDVKDNPYWRDCTDAELTFQIEGLGSPDGMSGGRLAGRVAVLEEIDKARRAFDSRPDGESSRFREKALALLTSGKVRSALDLRQESDRTRDRYGRHLMGQSCLAARRLVEAGARFVTVHYDCVDGYSWDSHTHSADVRSHLLPTLDQSLSALIEDLGVRGMLGRTLVTALGEMGRTPRANAQWGRDHWSFLFPALIAGGGARGGGLVGQSDKDGAHAISDAATPEDFAATLYHALGIDSETRITDSLGREVSLVEGGRVIRSIFA